ncbi:hypothetical protein BD414DRAFT_472546 [Trametes punicea]|nr:hypothetical protein BD414DRAFT_472546 [Trametes punicea]
MISSGRKKPTCHSCGHPMAGHKRPNGSPVCPRNTASLSPYPSPSPTPSSRRRSVSMIPTNYPDRPQSLLSRISPADVRFSPTPSGYWHRQNPNWTEPEHYARIPSHAPHQMPRRGETVAPWESTELNDSVAGSPPRGDSEPPGFGEEEDWSQEVQEDEADDADSLRAVSPAPSNGFARFSQHLVKMLGHSTPVVAEYSAPSHEVFSIEHAAQEEGLYSRIERRRTIVKAEPASPEGKLDEPSRSIAREGSWRIFVGRDRSTVDDRATSYATRRATPPPHEPYDYSTGLIAERNERVGTFPIDPRMIRQNFCDVIIAAVLSAVCVVLFLSYM